MPINSRRKRLFRELEANALNRAGYCGRHVPLGRRATFSTVLSERHPADKPVIDLMLAHVPMTRWMAHMVARFA